MMTLFQRKSMGGAIARLVGVVSFPLLSPLYLLGLLPYVFVWEHYWSRPQVESYAKGAAVFQDTPWVNYPTLIRIMLSSGLLLTPLIGLVYLPFCGLRWIMTAKWTCKSPLAMLESIL